MLLVEHGVPRGVVYDVDTKRTGVAIPNDRAVAWSIFAEVVRQSLSLVYESVGLVDSRGLSMTPGLGSIAERR